MKAIATSKRFVSVLALLLAIVMCFSACGGSEDVSSAGGDNTVSDASVESTASEDKTESEDTASVSSKPVNTPSNGAGDKKPVTGKAVWDKDYLKTMPASVKSKGLKILLWRDLHPTEQKLLDDFVKKTGCKVEKVITTEKEYSTKLVSLISAKNSPDICVLQNENFPGIVTKAMQPLDAKTFRLDDSCWNQPYMDAYSINGKTFCVAMPGSWSCEDCLYVTYYQPKVLKECGITKMPYDMYKDGKWNWDTQYEIASKVKGAGKGYIGISLQSYDLFMLSAGQDFVSYNGKQFKNQLGSVGSNSLLTEAWQAVAKLNESQLSTSWNLSQVQQGKVGLFTSIAYGMYNEGNWDFVDLPGGADSIEVVPVAGPKGDPAYTPYRPKTWGVPKGAKNVEGAAYFLRYWLDIDNCDMDATFLNKQCKKVYDIITKKSHKKQARTGCGVTNYVTANTYEGICNVLYSATPANVTTIINQKKGSVATGVTRANKDLTRIK